MKRQKRKAGRENSMYKSPVAGRSSGTEKRQVGEEGQVEELLERLKGPHRAL